MSRAAVYNDFADPERCCFVIIKPDAHQLGVATEIVEAIERANLRVHGPQTLVLDAELVRQVWPQIVAWTGRTITYMGSGASTVLLAEGPSATSIMLGLKRAFRAKYPDPNPVVSVMHTSDCASELRDGLRLFWPHLLEDAVR